MLEMHYDGTLAALGATTLTIHPNLVEAATLIGKQDALLASKRKLENAIDDWMSLRESSGYRRLSRSTRTQLEEKAASLANSLGVWTNKVLQSVAQDLFRQDAAVTGNTIRAFQSLADAMAALVTTTRSRIRRATTASAQIPPQTDLPPSEGGSNLDPNAGIPADEGMGTGAKVGIGLLILAVVGYGAYKYSEDEEGQMAGYGGKRKPRRVSKLEGLRIDGKLRGGCRYVKGGSIVCR